MVAWLARIVFAQPRPRRALANRLSGVADCIIAGIESSCLRNVGVVHEWIVFSASDQG